MSDSVSAAMNRIAQIRSAFGAGSSRNSSTGTAAGGFENLLSSATNGPSRAPSSSAPPGKATAAGTDPLDRIAVNGTSSTNKASKGLRSGSVGWPDGVPEEAKAYADEYIAASQATGVPLEILLAVSWAESAFRPSAQSGVGAQGLMQLMPGTAAGLGVDPNDPAQNIMGGARYLAAQYEAFGSWDLAFAAYNAGPGAVQQYGGIPPYSETQNYVSIINSYLDRITPAAPVVPPSNPVASTETQATSQRVALDAAQRALSGSVASATTPAALIEDQQALNPSLLADQVVNLTDPLTQLDQRRLSTADTVTAAVAPGDPSAGGATLAGTAHANATAVLSTSSADPSSSEMTTTAAALPERLAALVETSRSNGQSSHRLTVRLDPPELGTVNISFELKGDRVHIVVRPDSADGGQLLSQQRDRIATVLAREGLELSGFDVGSQADQRGGGRSTATARAYQAIDLDPITEVALTVDRELRL